MKLRAARPGVDLVNDHRCILDFEPSLAQQNGEFTFDFSPYHNHGIHVSGVNPSMNGLEFNGSSSYVNLSNSTSLNLSSNMYVYAEANASNMMSSPQHIFAATNYGLQEFDGDILFDIIGQNTSWTKSGDVGSRPRGLAVYDGRLWVACGSKIYVYNGSWTKSGDVGGASYGLAVYDGRLWVSCFGSNDIYVYNGSWTKSGDVGSSPRVFAVYDGRLWVSCFGSNDIYVYNGSWTKSGDVGSNPIGLAVYDGRLWAACNGANAIYVYNGSWTKSGDVGSGPTGLGVYDGRLWAACFGGGDVYVYNGSWTNSGNTGANPYTLATYDGRLWAACYGSGDVYVYGTGITNRIQNASNLRVIQSNFNLSSLTLNVNTSTNQIDHSLTITPKPSKFIIGGGNYNDIAWSYGSPANIFRGIIKKIYVRRENVLDFQLRANAEEVPIKE